MTVANAGKVYSDEPTYFVALQGKFANTHGHTRGRTIYGRVLTLNIDAATHGTVDFGLNDRVPAIAQLGPVTDFTDQL